ncbi:MAG: extracellular solute-binding protein [Paenibacillaceae bacterium]|nr:extracellular solute-binding protein [Paenibacillaceae bacterium]
MNHLKKRMTGASALILVASLAAACSGKQAASTSPSASPSASAAAGSSASAKPAEKKDFGTVIVSRPAAQDKPGNKKVIDYAKEKSGVEVKLVFGNDQVETFNLMQASGEKVDGVKVSMVQLTDMIAKKSVLPLDELIDKYGPNLKKAISPQLWDWAKGADGKIYGVPSASELHRYSPMIRTDWLKKLNLKAPTTIKEYEDVLVAFKNNGAALTGQQTKLYPLFVDYEQTDFALLGAFLPDGVNWWKSSDGTYLPPEMHPNYKKYLATLQNWHKMELINPETFVNRNLNQFGVRNMIGSTITWFSNAFFADFSKTLATYPDMTFDAIQLKGDVDLGVPALTQPSGAFVLNAKAPNPEGMIRFLDWSVSNKTDYSIVRRGLPGIGYDVVDKEKLVVKLKTPENPNDEYATTALQYIDLPLNSTTTEIAQDPRTELYYKYGDITGSIKDYPYLDNKLLLNESTLESRKKYGADIDKAKKEKYIRVVMGEDSVDSWDSFIDTWKKIGLNELIAEKNKFYKSKGL